MIETLQGNTCGNMGETLQGPLPTGMTLVEHERLARLTTRAWTQLRRHKKQSQIWRALERFLVVVAGRQSGKTEIARRKIVRWLPVIKAWQDPVYIYGLPTFAQAKKVAWDQINALIPDEWIVKNGRNRTEMCIRTIWGSKLYIAGLDKPERIEGNTVDGVILDECSDQRPEAYTKTVLPMLTHRNGWCMRIGVPKRNGCGAIQFKQAFDAGLVPNNLSIRSFTWSSRTILSDEQLYEIQGQMSTKDAEEQLGGIWTQGEGQIFYAYSEEINGNLSTIAEYDRNDVIGVGSDFNVSPMSWVLFHVKDGKMYVFDEVYRMNTNTVATLDYLYQKYGGHRSKWAFFGDASSKNRHSSTDTTDFLHIQNDKRFYTNGEPHGVHYPAKNPPVEERFAAANAKLCNANGVRSVFINPRCKYLREDLQQRSYKAGTREVDDPPGGLVGHMTDAFSYPIHKLWPISLILPPSRAEARNRLVESQDETTTFYVPGG